MDVNFLALDMIILFKILLYELVWVFTHFHTYIDIYGLLLSIQAVEVLIFDQTFFLHLSSSFPSYSLVHRKHSFT